MQEEKLKLSAKIARGLAFDAIAQCSSGHLGLPLGSAEVGAVLFAESLQFNPKEPRWLNRDRFILSAGHGSMFLYAWLHLSGYEVSLGNLKKFRHLGSITPGHPEFGLTPGVEATTGPLGQGVGNSVGFAITGKKLAEEFNTDSEKIFDYHVVALAGDGCLQEGISAESASLAGHLGLDNLILIYDSNDVTLDAMESQTNSEDVQKRFEAYNWDVERIDGHNFGEIKSALDTAKSNDNGKPKLIIAKTKIGTGIDAIAGTAAAHGESGIKYEKEFKAKLGLPEERFFVDKSVKDFFQEKLNERINFFNNWQEKFNNWKDKNYNLSKKLDSYLGKKDVKINKTLAKFPDDYDKATRVSSGDVIQEIEKVLPQIITGSADLFGSTKNLIKSAKDFGRGSYDGKNIWFGIREHAMGALLNGVAYENIYLASGATFAAFSSYLLPAIRLAALSKLQVIYIFTHDSIGVGEDGPTHQPVENISTLRLIPGLAVMRPADSEEVVGSYQIALERKNAPTAIILTRQNLPYLKQIPVEQRRNGARNGAYITKKEKSALKRILLSCGSELHLALEAAEELGDDTRVISMVSQELFDAMPAHEREEILPSNKDISKIAIEAGVGALWRKYVGTEGKIIGVESYGHSAPAEIIMQEFGLTVENIVNIAKKT